jgi:hypothetical protein
MLGEDFGRNGAGEKVGLRHVPCETGETGAATRLGSEPTCVLNLHADLPRAPERGTDVDP